MPAGSGLQPPQLQLFNFSTPELPNSGLLMVIICGNFYLMASLDRKQLLIDDEIKRLKEHFRGRKSMIVNFDVNDVIPNPTPMTVDFISELMTRNGAYGLGVKQTGGLYSRSLGNQSLLATFMGRAYLDMGMFFKSQFGWLPVYINVEQLMENPEKVYNPDLKLKPWAWPVFILLLPYYICAIARFLILISKRRKRLEKTFFSEIEPRTIKIIEEKAAIDYSSLNDLEIIKAIRQMRVILNTDLYLPHQWTDVISFFLMTLLKMRLKTLYGRDAESRLNRMLQGYDERNPVTRCGKDLERLSRGQLTMEEFLAEHGHRAAPDAELSAPRWNEQPEQVEKIIDVLKAGISDSNEGQIKDKPQDPAEFFEEPKNIWRWLLKLFPGWRKQYISELKSLKTILAIREAAKLDALRMYEPLRKAVLELGTRKGLEGDDIFFLKFNELGKLAKGENLKALINQRREQREEMLKVDAPPFISSEWLDMPYSDWPSMKKPRAEKLSNGSTVLKGYGVSPGIIKGRARVITDLSQGKSMKSGEILVVSWTDPSWTAIFHRASGVVTEVGGVLSHGVVVARELGLPAVSALRNATKTIKTGDIITVDGKTGTVTINRSMKDEV